MKKLLCLIVALMMCTMLFTACDDETYMDDEMYEEEAMEDEMMDDAEDDMGEAETDMEDETGGNVVDLGTAADGVPFGSFTTTSVYGHEVTDAVFADYAMTMVNVWATWCPPCIEEMDELEEVYQTLPDNVNVLTLCDDGSTETALALQILEENGCNFDAIAINDEIKSGFMTSQQITAFPTTVFVDSAGNVFADPIVGAPYDAVEFYMAAAEAAMEMLS